MNRMREKAKAAGLEGVHWNLVAWGNPILPGEEVPANIPELIRKLGFDSSTSYVWIHHVPLPNVQTDYNYVRDKYFEHWDQANEECRSEERSVGTEWVGRGKSRWTRDLKKRKNM